MLDLSEWGMVECDDVLIQGLGNGKAMQVRLEPDRIDVRMREVSIEAARETSSPTPPWNTAYDLAMARWIETDSPVWQWLKSKGIQEIQARRRILGLK